VIGFWQVRLPMARLEYTYLDFALLLGVLGLPAGMLLLARLQVPSAQLILWPGNTGGEAGLLTAACHCEQEN